MSFYNQELQEIVKSLRFIQYLRRSSKDNEDKQMRSIDGQMQDIEPLIKQYNIKLVREPFVEKRSAFETGSKYTLTSFDFAAILSIGQDRIPAASR